MSGESLITNHVPPYCNTGVQNTSQSGLRACVDWVQATFKIVEVTQLIEEVLGLNADWFYEGQSGSMGYRKSRKYGNITVFYDGTEEMGVHLQMTGQGCREYEAYNRKKWKQLFFDFVCYNAKFTRLDVAIDDFQGYFTISSIERKVKDRLLVSKFKKARTMETILIESGEGEGKTIYFGSSQSSVQIRMYEKNHEQKGKGNEIDSDVWNRTEVQARDERAQKIAELIMLNEDSEETVGEIVAGILKYYLRFLVKGKDKNRSRWKTAPFWDKFLGNIEALRLTDIAPDRTVEKTVNWISNQVAPSLAVMFEAFDGDVNLLMRFIQEGKERLTEKEYRMINEYKNQQRMFVQGQEKSHLVGTR